MQVIIVEIEAPESILIKKASPFSNFSSSDSHEEPMSDKSCVYELNQSIFDINQKQSAVVQEIKNCFRDKLVSVYPIAAFRVVHDHLSVSYPPGKYVSNTVAKYSVALNSCTDLKVIVLRNSRV